MLLDWQLLPWASHAAGCDAVCPDELDSKHACMPSIAKARRGRRISALNIRVQLLYGIMRLGACGYKAGTLEFDARCALQHWIGRRKDHE